MSSGELIMLVFGVLLILGSGSVFARKYKGKLFNTPALDIIAVACFLLGIAVVVIAILTILSPGET